MLSPWCLVKARGNLLKDVATDQSEQRGEKREQRYPQGVMHQQQQQQQHQLHQHQISI